MAEISLTVAIVSVFILMALCVLGIAAFILAVALTLIAFIYTICLIIFGCVIDCATIVRKYFWSKQLERTFCD